MESYSEIDPPRIQPPTTTFGLGTGVGTWLVSILALALPQLVFIVGYAVYYTAQYGAPPTPESLTSSLPVALLVMASALLSHILTLAFCFYILNREPRPWTDSLQWGWSPGFMWPQAIVLAVLMLVFSVVLQKFVPHHETDMERLLKLGLSVRILTAFLAVATAPLVEEIVYRGILYPAVANRLGVPLGIFVTAALFGLVHVPQYWGSPAAVTVIMLLSVVLTVLRAYTGKLMPCIATHLVYNGIQAVLLVSGLEKLIEPEKATNAAFALGPQFGALADALTRLVGLN